MISVTYGLILCAYSLSPPDIEVVGMCFQRFRVVVEREVSVAEAAEKAGGEHLLLPVEHLLAGDAVQHGERVPAPLPTRRVITRVVLCDKIM